MNELLVRREALEHASLSSVRWFQRLVGALPDRAEELTVAVEAVEALRNRELSTLINVALLGGFSSGKTFLASGLQGGLELIRVATGGGSAADKFVGLLPSAPTPTTACPARLVPVQTDGVRDASGRGFLRVRFVDSDRETWEDVGNSLPPPMVAAYAMQRPDATGRLQQHWQREVAEVEILLSEYKLPADFYDLPGLGSPNSVHDAIVRAAMNDADCFIYVASATRSLSEDDLSLIKTLYDHYLAYRKPVIWVLTAIDRVMDLGIDDKPGWHATIELNNAYLKENFCPSGESDASFIGRGFVPVSPALEARGNLLIKEDGFDAKADGQRDIAESRMEELRQFLADLISQETGRLHIASLASQIQSYVDPWRRTVQGIADTERIPLDELAKALFSHNQRIQRLGSQSAQIRETLLTELTRHVRVAAKPFDRLPGFMHRLLDGEIRDADLLREKVSNRIEVLKIHELRIWLASQTGPATLWEREFDAFKADAIKSARGSVGYIPTDLISSADDEFDIETWIYKRSKNPSPDSQDAIERASAVMGLAKPVVGAGILAAGGAGISLPFALPAGLGAAAMALLYGAVGYYRSRSTSLSEMRRERIEALSDEVASIRHQFIATAIQQGVAVIDQVVERIASYRRRLEEEAELIDFRMRNPENQQRLEVIANLDSLLGVGSDISKSLSELE